MLLRKSLRCNYCGINKTHFRLKHIWKEPTGHDTKIKIYNEIVKEKVPLIFPNKNYVKWYMCGPTVYDKSHIGHACCYIKLDIIHRILKEYYDIHPIVAIGVTDVAEEIFNKSRLHNKHFWEIGTKYSTEFFEQMKALNILQPSFKLKVTDHIPIILKFIDLLMRRMAAYKGVDGSIYFNTEADPNYGRFREPPVTNEREWKAGKRNPRDFALWKSDKNCETHVRAWGKGLPGWHIECSAMASHVFGSNIDIHSGGSDLIFPHHENEEAQSTCYHKCDQWVNYWIHAGLINVGNVKMSKSLGNVISISDFLEHHRSDHLRMFCFMSSYRSELNYDDMTIQLAINTCEKINSFLDIAESYVAGTWALGNVEEAQVLQELEKTKKAVKKNLANDFGTGEALKAVMLLVKNTSKMLSENPDKSSSRSPATIAAVSAYVKQFFRSFGFTFAETLAQNESTSAVNTVINAAVNFRSQVRGMRLQTRSSNDVENPLVLCDKFRKKLLTSGVVVCDLGPSQSHWYYKSSAVENKTLLKDLIDYTIWFWKEILNIATKLKVHQNKSELLEACRYIEMYLATLGISIEDNATSRSEWTFPNLDKVKSPLLEGILHATLQFHCQVQETAKALPQEEGKQLICLCESLISDLDELGVNVDEKARSFEIEDEKGTSLLNIVIETFVHFRVQALIVANLTRDSHLKNDLYRDCGHSRKNLASYGFFVFESSPYFLPSWKMKYNSVNNTVLINVVDVTVKLMNDLMKMCQCTEDLVARRVILELCNSVISDLSPLGIVVEHVPKKNFTWYFKPCKLPGGHPISCSPPLFDNSGR